MIQSMRDRPIRLILFIIIDIILIAILAFVIVSQGKEQPIDGGISIMGRVDIGGIEQYLIIRGQDESKPILLFLHGGPGVPEYPLYRKYLNALEREFVVVSWEQRGAGKSYFDGMNSQKFNIDQFVSDGVELTAFLKNKYNKEKIYVMGHSWGAYLGMKMINESPDDYYAYFGVGLPVSMSEGEEESYNWVLEEAKEADDESVVEWLEDNYPTSNSSDEWIPYIKTQRGYVEEYGGSSVVDLGNTAWEYVITREYTILDKLYYINGNSYYTMEHMWEEMMDIDLRTEVPEVEVPVYIFQGEMDYQTPTSLVEGYYELLEAPDKELFIYEDAAHNALYEYPKKFILDVTSKIQE